MWRRAMTETPPTSSPQSASQQPSATGYEVRTLEREVWPSCRPEGLDCVLRKRQRMVQRARNMAKAAGWRWGRPVSWFASHRSSKCGDIGLTRGQKEPRAPGV